MDRVTSTETSAIQAVKPFKVFVSLLDKWEIGGELSKSLALEAILSIKRACKGSTLDDTVKDSVSFVTQFHMVKTVD